jgi:hypothetical protein
LPQNGVLDPGDVVVLAGDMRVTAVTGRLGADVGEPVLTVASTSKVVTLKVDSSDTVRAAAKVVVTLPNGTTMPGVVNSVVTKKEGDQPVVTATVGLDDLAVVRDLDAAAVTVDVQGEVRTGVLTVPVGALLALREGGYAVQVVDKELVAVTTGLFAKGLVEITGVPEGVTLVTTS